MGCFNVSCGMSSISMGTDDAVLIPLIPNRFKAKDCSIEIHGANIVSNDGAMAFFKPLTLPIFGTLDSYGGLEDIEEDANTKAIEKFYGIDIDKFASAVYHGGGSAAPKTMPKFFAGMYVHREIYDEMSSFSVDEWGKNFHETEYSDLHEGAVNLLGFSFKSQEKGKERYNRLFTNPLFPTVQIWHDGQQWLELVIDGKKFCRGRRL